MEKISKIDKPLARFIEKILEKTQINKIGNEKGEFTTDSTEIPRIIKDFYEQFYANKMDKLEETDIFLERLQSLKTEPGRNRKYEQTQLRSLKLKP